MGIKSDLGLLIFSLVLVILLDMNERIFFFFRWLPVDVARMWGRHWLEPLLAPNSNSIIPTFPPSNYLSVPLLSVLNIGRYFTMNYA